MTWGVVRGAPLLLASFFTRSFLLPVSLPDYMVSGLSRSNPKTLGTGIPLHFDSAAGGELAWERWFLGGPTLVFCRPGPWLAAAWLWYRCTCAGLQLFAC